jgi:hypothetical protein
MNWSTFCLLIIFLYLLGFIYLYSCTELLGLFWTLSIVLYVEDKKSHKVSETGSVSILRWMGQDKPTQLGPLERASLGSNQIEFLRLEYGDTIKRILTLKLLWNVHMGNTSPWPA